MAVDVAKGIHDHPHLKLGAVTGKRDAKLVTLDPFIKEDMVQAPASYDFDKGRKAFPSRMWGNNAFGDCEVAGRANYALRLERVETRATPDIEDDDVITEYKLMTGCESPGDNNDTGLTTPDNLNKWRHGWEITKAWKHGATPATRTYNIFAYGFVTPSNHDLVRLATYLFHGIIIGANLPVAAQTQFETNQVWDVVNDSTGEPGSWGGHCMYGKAYDKDHMKLLTWQREVIVTNAWWNEYVDESYCVIDAHDVWRNSKHVFDIDALVAEMRNAGISINQ